MQKFQSSVTLGADCCSAPLKIDLPCVFHGAARRPVSGTLPTQHSAVRGIINSQQMALGWPQLLLRI